MQDGWTEPSGLANGDTEEWLAASLARIKQMDVCIKFVHFYKFIWRDAFIIWLKWDCDYEDWWCLENKVFSLAAAAAIVAYPPLLWQGNAFAHSAQCEKQSATRLCIAFYLIHTHILFSFCAGCCSRLHVVCLLFSFSSTILSNCAMPSPVTPMQLHKFSAAKNSVTVIYLRCFLLLKESKKKSCTLYKMLNVYRINRSSCCRTIFLCCFVSVLLCVVCAQKSLHFLLDCIWFGEIQRAIILTRLAEHTNCLEFRCGWTLK